MSIALVKRPGRASAAAFSLIEVVLAVAIMALGVVTILGLLPHGLEVTRKTANELAESRIVDTILGDLQAMDWTKLNDAAGDAEVVGSRFFDDQGLVINKGDEELPAILSYVADVQIPELDVHLPTNAANPADNSNLRRVIIRVAATPKQDIDLQNPGGVAVHTYTQLIARTR
jgi:uncharacterized protein (TIGR02598 family)